MKGTSSLMANSLTGQVTLHSEPNVKNATVMKTFTQTPVC